MRTGNRFPASRKRFRHRARGRVPPSTIRRGMGRVRLGTSSWSEKGWVGSFYPAGMAPRDFLAWYATRFDCVEVDATYYAVPRPALAAGWAAKVPDGFALAGKFPRSIVHAGEGPKPDAERVLRLEHVGADLEAFLSAMALLGPRCGPLVLQFPHFDRRAFPALEAFLERLGPFLDALPRDFRYAVEVRNRDWIQPALCELLRERSVALCWVDLTYVPHPDRWGDLDPVTADFGYARLIGDRRATEALTQTFDRVVVDRTDRLERWARFLASVAPRLRETFVFANNHFAGHGPATLAQLATLLAAGGTPPAPWPPPGGSGKKDRTLWDEPPS